MKELTASVREQIDHWIAKYPANQKQSAVIAALTIVQEHNGGWLTNELVETVADYLGIPKIAAYEVATFYSMLELSPTGQHKINVCNSISCMLRGSEKIIEHLKKRLRINVNETTPNGKFTLKAVECLAACANAPACYIGKQYYEDLTPSKIDAILDTLEGQTHG